MTFRSNIDTFYVATTGRKMFFKVRLDEYKKDDAKRLGTPRCVALDEANLVSSEVTPDKHLPVIDCDYGIQAVPSSSPGHYHLYIDKELTWRQYAHLLDGLLAAGLIQKAWYESAMRDKRSYVRLPHVHKPKPQPAPATNEGPF